MNGHEFYKMLASASEFSTIDPGIASFLKQYLVCEKAIAFADRYILNTHFPPYPGKAFERMIASMHNPDIVADRTLYSVTLAVTNRCHYHCWHCYNAGRSQVDMPLARFTQLARELDDMKAVMITLSGGEPLLRPDLEEIVGFFSESICLNLNTTGDGLTYERAKKLHQNGLFGVGVSLDSETPASHDRMRGMKGAFDTAVRAIRIAADSGLYPYVVTVPTHELLVADRFESFMQYIKKLGALEIHILEPCATGNLQGQDEAILTTAECLAIVEFQKMYASRADMPILSSFLYLESPHAFGCGAGVSHLYIDGAGNVCPCNLVPLGFGNIMESSLRDILEDMSEFFLAPRTCCIGKSLSGFIPAGEKPLTPELSRSICLKHLPKTHPLPCFFEVQKNLKSLAGAPELKSAYDDISSFYDDFWVVEAGKPVVDLVESLEFASVKKIIEAGCGTGFATCLLAEKNASSDIVAIDLSAGMLKAAIRRVSDRGLTNISFQEGDALELMCRHAPADLIFTSWVLGYIPLVDFFNAAFEALQPGGRVAFIVHRDNSPEREFGIFREIAIENPEALMRQVKFDFPADADAAARVASGSGFVIERMVEGAATFRYDSAESVLDHLLKSGAGTVFYESVRKDLQEEMATMFLARLSEMNRGQPVFEVVHRYVAGIVRKPATLDA